MNPNGIESKLAIVKASYNRPIHRKIVSQKPIKPEYVESEVMQNWPFIQINNNFNLNLHRDFEQQQLQKLIYQNYGILSDEYEPQKQLSKLRRFYSKNRPRDLITFYLESTYDDTHYKQRFNKDLQKRKMSQPDATLVTERPLAPQNITEPLVEVK